MLNSFQHLNKKSINILKTYYVYILTNKRNTVFYIGVTNDLKRRAYEHKQKKIDGFTKRYNLTKLVYFEQTTDVRIAIQREKQLKNWHREWKLNLIKSENPGFKDLAEGWYQNSEMNHQGP